MPSKPLVSIIITTYNRSQLLVEAIESVLRQTYPHVEVLVADDGSSDNTAACVHAVDGPIRYLRLVHTGRPSVTRNRALAQARGDLIAFLDDDDLWLPHKLARQVELLASDAALGWVYGDFRFLHLDGTQSSPALKPQQRVYGNLWPALLDDCFIHPSTVMVRRSLLSQTGWFDESLAITEDYDLWLRLAYLAPAGILAEPLVLVRRHTAGISQQRVLLSYQNTITVLERAGRNRLTAAERIRLRKTLARMYAHVGLALAQSEPHSARRRFLHSLRLNPAQRRAWQALAAGLRDRWLP